MPGTARSVPTCTPITSIVGPRGLDRDRHPADQPAAADGHDHARQVGHLLEQLEPERALAGDHVGILERMDERHRARLGGELARRLERLVDGRADHLHRRRRAPRAASTLAIGADSGMNTSHGTPRARAA